MAAPVRLLDAGGWTDTWFAGHGLVCHMAVTPGVEVAARRLDGEGRLVDLEVAAFADRYTFDPERPPRRHPLLEAAIRRHPPEGPTAITIASAVPPGSGLGTSAAVVVALLAALRILRGSTIAPAALAAEAHHVETADLGLQSGVQDQLAAAYGGANLITIDPYPAVDVQRIEVPASMWAELARRLITVYLGAPHTSSAVHDAVIADMHADRLEPLREAARHAAAALADGDVDAYGEAMRANTTAQAALHPSLVDDRAREVIALAERHGAPGWKVNGAGGDGGTVTVIGPEHPGALVAELGHVTILDLRPARSGVRLVSGPPTAQLG